MENSQGIVILVPPREPPNDIFICFQSNGTLEKGNYMVSDGKFPGKFQMGKGLGYGVWDENGEWWGTSKNINFEF